MRRSVVFSVSLALLVLMVAAGPLAATVYTVSDDCHLGPGAPSPPLPAGDSLEGMGWVDMHTHPMSHLGFGKKAMHGVPDEESLVPAGTRDCNDRDFRAGSIEQALGHCNSTHGGWGTDNTCGNYIRAAVINFGLDAGFVHQSDNPHGDHHHDGFPDFRWWPHHTSILHQQMWHQWLRRAHEGGLRAIVALTVNNELLAAVLDGDDPMDDTTVANLQIDETIAFVDRHRDFMEIARGPADMRRIIRSGRLAVILGMEVDNLGNVHQLGGSYVHKVEAVKAEIRRLHGKGVRYVFPIHLVDNPLGGTAVFNMLFNFANKYSTGSYYSVQTSADPNVAYSLTLSDGPFGFENGSILGIRGILEGLGELPMDCFNLDIKCFPPPGKLRCCEQYETILNAVSPAADFDLVKAIPGGHVNRKGLTPLGREAIAEMMRLGMMIDIDHMSEKSARETLAMAKEFHGGYPVNMGHNEIRGPGGNERGAPADVVADLAALGGVFGVGTADSNPHDFIAAYTQVRKIVKDGGVAIGTDVNGFEPLPTSSGVLDPRRFYGDGGFYQCRTGKRIWDYTQDGVAHYGLMPEFLEDVAMQPGGREVVAGLFDSTERFARMWESAEARAKGPALPQARHPIEPHRPRVVGPAPEIREGVRPVKPVKPIKPIKPVETVRPPILLQPVLTLPRPEPQANQLILEIRTGDDDLRGGSNDNVHLRVRYRDGSQQVVRNINRSRGWSNDSDHTVTVSLDRAVPPSRIASLDLFTEFTGGFDGDNWNMDRLKVRATGGNVDRVIYERADTPLFRFTGDRRSFSTGPLSIKD